MDDIEKYDIIICSNRQKKEFLKANLFNSVKYISLEEFRNKYLFKYADDTIYYVMKKYNFKPENAHILLKSLYYLEDINPKLHHLIEMRNDLDQNGFLIYNSNFKKFVKNKKIGICYPKSKEFPILFKDLYYQYLTEKIVLRDIPIYECVDIDDEVIFAASKIVDLLLSGVDINKIKIVKNEEVYDGVIKRIFSLFNIPYFSSVLPLYYLTEVKELLDTLDFNKTVADLIEFIREKSIDDNIKSNLLNILSKYLKINPILSDFYDVLIYELKNKTLKNQYSNVINEISIEEVEKDDYIFILGFNQDIFPKYQSDDEYLTDREYIQLGLDSSIDRNNCLNEKIIAILQYPNIFLSYKLKTPFDKYTISNLSEKLNFHIVNPQYDFSNYQINQVLLASKLDEYFKYNVVASDLEELYGSLDISYNTYDNRYSIVDDETLKDKIKDLNLSFSNIDIFYKCQFRFYLENILKLRKNKETVSIEIGNLFHKVLEEYYKTKIDLEIVIDNILSSDELDSKQKFYRQKYKKLIIELVEIMDKQLENTDYKAGYFEKWFSVLKDKDLNIKIVGKIDKVMLFSDTVNNYVIVIDYKTGALHADFNKIVYGLDMQLLIYIYLIKNTDLIEDPIFTGMYLEPILTNVLKSENNHTYKELLTDKYKWVGYTIDNFKYLRNIDKNYDVNSFISGIRVKNDGTFYSNSKVLTEDNLNKLLDIVSKKIENAISMIKKADFKINPKRIGKNNVSCPYCPYQDICYRTNNDLVSLREYKDLEFLDEEVNHEA